MQDIIHICMCCFTVYIDTILTINYFLAEIKLNSVFGVEKEGFNANAQKSGGIDI